MNFVTEHEYVLVFRKHQSLFNLLIRKNGMMTNRAIPTQMETKKYKMIKLAKWGSVQQGKRQSYTSYTSARMDRKFAPKAP